MSWTHALKAAHTPELNASRSMKAKQRWAAGVYAGNSIKFDEAMIAAVRQCQAEGVTQMETADRIGVDVKVLRRWLVRTAA